MFQELPAHYHGTLGDYISNVYQPYFESLGLKSLPIERLRLDIIKTYEISDIPYTQITKNDAISFFTQLRTARDIGKASLNRYRSRLCNIFNYGIAEGHTYANPFAQVKKLKEKPRKRVYSISEINRVLEECKSSKNSELYTIAVLALNTGMRKGELLKIEMKSVSLKQKNIYLPDYTTKSGESREIPLNDAAFKVLKAHIESHSPVVRTDSHGKTRIMLFKSKSIRTAWQNALKRAGVEQATFHDLRRTFATYLKDEGLSLHTIKELLGHSSITMTEIYLSTQGSALYDGVSRISFC